MSGTMCGYARVSTRTQKEDRQVVALQGFGVAPKHIIVEKQSGKNFDRPLYQRLVQAFLPGDVLVVKSIDRLDRSYGEILEQWSYITKTRETAIVVLDMPLLDTREGPDLTGTLVADIVLQLLSYVAQTERELIRQRQAEGIAATLKRGVCFGPDRIPMPEGFEQLAEKWWNGHITATEAGKTLGISRKTFTRRTVEWGVGRGLTKRIIPRK